MRRGEEAMRYRVSHLFRSPHASCKISRKGYFFVIDAFLAGILLFTAVILLLSKTSSIPSTSQTYLVLGGMLDTLTYTQVRDVSNVVTTQLIADGNLTNSQFTFAEQANEFYDRRQTQGCSFCLGRARILIESISNGSIPSNYGYRYKINGTTIIEKNIAWESESTLVAVQSFVIFTSRNATSTIGPYQNRFEVWIR